MERFKRHFGLAVLVSELGHIFCCVLPTIFTALSFAANIGLISMAPSWVMEIHERIHHYEAGIIIFSGSILVLGWAAFYLANKVDCHNTGCGHPPCDPHKAKNKKIMIIATALFLFNLSIYAFVHKNILNLHFMPQGHEVLTEEAGNHNG